MRASSDPTIQKRASGKRQIGTDNVGTAPQFQDQLDQMRRSMPVYQDL